MHREIQIYRERETKINKVLGQQYGAVCQEGYELHSHQKQKDAVCETSYQYAYIYIYSILYTYKCFSIVQTCSITTLALIFFFLSFFKIILIDIDVKGRIFNRTAQQDPSESRVHSMFFPHLISGSFTLPWSNPVCTQAFYIYIWNSVKLLSDTLYKHFTKLN